MIAQNIKAILGEELALQLETALQGKGKDGKDVDLVVGNDGSFVPAEKYSNAQMQALGAEKALQAAVETIKTVGGTGNVETFLQDIAAVKATIETQQQSHEKEKNSLLKKASIKMALAGQVHDPVDILERLDLEQVELDERGDLQNGWESQLQGLRQSKPYLFLEKQASAEPRLQGAKPAQANPAANEQPQQNKNEGPVFF